MASLDRHDSLAWTRKGEFRSRDSENTIRRQTWSHVADVVALWQHVSAHELSRHVAVLVFLLLVFTLDSDALVVRSDGDLFRRELLHVHDHLEFVLTRLDLHRTANLVLQLFHHVPPRLEELPESGQLRWSEQVISGAQPFEMVLQSTVVAVHVFPPIAEQIPRYQCHLAAIDLRRKR